MKRMQAKAHFYQHLVRASQLLGPWFFRLVAGGIAAGYFCFRPDTVANSRRFYAALYPARSPWFHLWCAWRQFQNFTLVFMDRFLLQDDIGIRFSSRGLSHLRSTMARGRGGILIMSHLGNWEMAARLLKDRLPGLRLMLLMGSRNHEQIETLQKQSVAQSGVRIVAVDETGGSPMDVLEAMRFLRSGGLVSLTGDRLWHPDQRAETVSFLGHATRVPAAPYVLALASESPVHVFFAFRRANRRYHFTASPPLAMPDKDRRQRSVAIQNAAQQYADRLQDTLRRHPTQWFHFEPFFIDPQASQQLKARRGG